MRVGILLLALIAVPSHVATGGGKVELSYLVRQVNHNVSCVDAYLIANTIQSYAKVMHMDPRLLAAVIAVESKFRVKATGSIGEVGLMQLRPEFHALHIKDRGRRIASLYGVDSNIKTGSRYLASLRDRFNDTYGPYSWIELFNRGPSAKPKKLVYTKRVLKYYHQFGGRL